MAQELCEETSQICTEELFLRADIEREIFGQRDDYVRRIENELGVTILSRNGTILVSGGKKGVRQAVLTLNQLAVLAKRGTGIEEQNVNYVLEMKKEAEENPDLLPALDSEVICHTTSGKPIKPKTIGQEKYIKAIRDNLIIFANGPAGTGKTFLAMAMAITAFQNKEVERIILTRPAIEAGEKLGFLPGDLQSKVDPYLRPLYDGLFDMMGAETFNKLLERGSIEVAPLAYMRGRTLDDSFIILDEAQNTTPEQMKMFLTRIGFGSKAVVTGDITQIDLPGDRVSGLKEAVRVLKNVEDIAQCQLTDKDVVRHELVQRIVRAYEKYEQQKQLRAKESAAKRRTQNRK